METLTALRVTYDANVAFKIVNRQLGVAKKLLYELKTVPISSLSNLRRPVIMHSQEATN